MVANHIAQGVPHKPEDHGTARIADADLYVVEGLTPPTPYLCHRAHGYHRHLDVAPFHTSVTVDFLAEQVVPNRPQHAPSGHPMQNGYQADRAEGLKARPMDLIKQGQCVFLPRARHCGGEGLAAPPVGDVGELSDNIWAQQGQDVLGDGVHPGN